MASVTYVGHSTVLVDLDGTRLLTDPLLRTRVAHLRRRTSFALEELRDLDAVLVSHAHYDHLDLPSLDVVGRSTPVVVPRGLGQVAAASRLRRRDGDRRGRARHDRRRDAWTRRSQSTTALVGRSERAARALGFVLGGTRRLYFAGDTDLFDGMEELSGEARPRARADLGLGALARQRAPRPRGRRQGGRAPQAADRGADPLGHLPPRLPRASAPCRRSCASLRSASSRPRPRVAPEVEIRVLQPGETLEL